MNISAKFYQRNLKTILRFLPLQITQQNTNNFNVSLATRHEEGGDAGGVGKAWVGAVVDEGFDNFLDLPRSRSQRRWLSCCF